MVSDVAHDAPNAAQQSNQKPGALLVISAVILAALNALLSYMVAEAKASDGSSFALSAIGYVFCGVVLWQALVVALFWIGRRFRNPRSALKIYCWTSIVVLLGAMAQIGMMLPK